jgi:hypothetical protein
MQFGGSNYLIPVNAALLDQTDRGPEASQEPSYLVLDACRVNPLAEELSWLMELTRGPPVDRGLAGIRQLARHRPDRRSTQ